MEKHLGFWNETLLTPLSTFRLKVLRRQEICTLKQARRLVPRRTCLGRRLFGRLPATSMEQYQITHWSQQTWMWNGLKPNHVPCNVFFGTPVSTSLDHAWSTLKHSPNKVKTWRTNKLVVLCLGLTVSCFPKETATISSPAVLDQWHRLWIDQPQNLGNQHFHQSFQETRKLGLAKCTRSDGLLQSDGQWCR